jgi:hypothetical protein
MDIVSRCQQWDSLAEASKDITILKNLSLYFWVLVHFYNNLFNNKMPNM